MCCSWRYVRKIEPPLNAIKARLHPVDAPVYLADAYPEVAKFHLHSGHADFQIEHIRVDPIKPQVHPSELFAEVVQDILIRIVAHATSYQFTATAAVDDPRIHLFSHHV